MNRTLTNSIRYVLDNWLPPAIRDNKYFMYPLFYVWFKGKNIKEIMEFKSRVYHMSEKEFGDFYANRDSLAVDRPTDLSEESIQFMFSKFDTEAKSILDVGCGGGYFIQKAAQKGLNAYACDVIPDPKLKNVTFVQGTLEKLPFEDNSFDIVTCHHTLEHVINLQNCISELKRVAKKQLIIVVPCQRYFYYTLDEHIRFFPYKELLTSEIKLEKHTCDNIWGDWVYIGTLS